MTLISAAIGYRNDIKDLTVTGSSEDSAFPANNASAHSMIPRAHTASGVTTATWDVDTGASPAVTPEFQLFAAFGLDGLDLDNATVQWIVDNNSGYGSPTIDSTALSIDTTYTRSLGALPWSGPAYGYIHTTSSAHRYFRFKIINTGGADARVSVIWAGPMFRPAIGYEFDKYEPLQSDGRRRKVRLTYGWLTNSEAYQLLDICESLNRLGRVALIPKDNEEESYLAEIMLCNITSWTRPKPAIQNNTLCTMTIELTEVGF